MVVLLPKPQLLFMLVVEFSGLFPTKLKSYSEQCVQFARTYIRNGHIYVGCWPLLFLLFCFRI
jgi:hypothetical protein